MQLIPSAVGTLTASTPIQVAPASGAATWAWLLVALPVLGAVILLDHVRQFCAPQRNQSAFHTLPRAIANIFRFPLACDHKSQFTEHALQERLRRLPRVQTFAQRGNGIAKRL